MTNAEFLARLIEQYMEKRGVIVYRDKKRAMKIMSMLEKLVGDFQAHSDAVGAALWHDIWKFYSWRSAKIRKDDAGKLAFLLLMFGRDLDEITINMRANLFWREIFPTVLDLRLKYNQMISKHEIGGEYYGDPIIKEKMQKNVEALKSIIDLDIFPNMAIRNDFVVRDLIDLYQTKAPYYVKSIMGAIHLFYLVNRYGIRLNEDSLRALSLDADDLYFDKVLTSDSLRFLRGIADKMEA